MLRLKFIHVSKRGHWKHSGFSKIQFRTTIRVRYVVYFMAVNSKPELFFSTSAPDFMSVTSWWTNWENQIYLVLISWQEVVVVKAPARWLQFLWGQMDALRRIHHRMHYHSSTRKWVILDSLPMSQYSETTRFSSAIFVSYCTKFMQYKLH